MSNHTFSLFLCALKGLRDFNALDPDDRQIVFYSEDNNSWVFFEPIIKELLETYGKKICYLTSSANDPVLSRQEDKIKGFYIGSGLLRTYLFFTLKVNIMVMTMPNLETDRIKRSRAKQVHYVYVFHGMVSTTMIYRFNAFDHFDALLCVGPYHIKEIRANEKLYNLKPKTLIENGYGRLDSIIEEAKNRPRTVHGKGKRNILVAPTWGNHALLETCAFELVDILLASGYQVTYRPHTMTLRHQKKLLTELQIKFTKYKNFKYETDLSSQESLHASDIMITDWSGTAIEYAFGLEHPVIFIDLPRKVNNPEYQKFPLEPFEVAIRSKIGVAIPPDHLEDLPKKIEELCNNPDSFRQEILKIRSENVYNLGTSGAAGAAYIAQTI